MKGVISILIVVLFYSCSGTKDNKFTTKIPIEEKDVVLQLNNRPYRYTLIGYSLLLINYGIEVVKINIHTGNASVFFRPDSSLLKKTFNEIKKNNSKFNFYPLSNVVRKYKKLYRIVGITKYKNELYLLGLFKTMRKSSKGDRFREMYFMWVVGPDKKIENIITGFETCSDPYHTFIFNKRNFCIEKNKIYIPAFSLNGTKVNYLTYRFNNHGEVEDCIPEIEGIKREKVAFYKNRKVIFSDKCKRGCFYYDGKNIKDINGDVKTQIKTNTNELIVNFCQLNNPTEYIYLKVKTANSHSKKKFIYSILKSQNNFIKDSIFLGSSDSIKNIGICYPYLLYFIVDEKDNVFMYYQSLQNI